MHSSCQHPHQAEKCCYFHFTDGELRVGHLPKITQSNILRTGELFLPNKMKEQ